MKKFFEVTGSCKRFHDIVREFEDIESARKCAEEMKRDGLRTVEIHEVTEVKGIGRFAHSV